MGSSAAMPILPALTILLATVPVRAETVYEFTLACREDELAKCFDKIEERMIALKAAGPGRRICLPRAFGATMFESLEVPVSVLEHVRLGLSAARFGQTRADVDDVIRQIVSGIYPCE